MGDNETINTSLSLGIVTTTDPSSSGNRNRKKPRKQKHPVSSFYPPTVKSISSKLQPVSLIHLDKRTELYNMFRKANWEPILYYSNKNVFPNMVFDFYKNMEVKLGPDNLVYLTTMINKKPILLDHEELGKALKISTSHLKLANVDIAEDFVFNKNEMRLYLSVLCGHEVPYDLFVEDTGVSYEHFTPIFQTLTLIIRNNIYPNTSNSMLVHFAEMKLMYKLAGHKVHFNLAYMMLVQMINGHNKGYMFYGLILTKVFEHFKLNVNILPYFPVENTISEKVNRVVIPLAGLPPPPHSQVINLDPTPSAPTGASSQSVVDDKLAKLQASHNELAELYKTLQESFQNLAMKLELIEARVGILVNILSGTISRAGRIEDGINQLIHSQFGFLDMPLLPLVEEVATETPVMAQTGGADALGNGINDMETDLVNDTVPNSTGMESLD